MRTPTTRLLRRGGLMVGLLTLSLMATEVALADDVTLTDTEIRHAVNDEMLTDPAVNSLQVDVAAVEGVVTLSGKVSNLLARERAAKIAMTVRGVRSVINRIVVEPATRPSDADLMADVTDALLKDPATESFEIGVLVTDGHVTLTGEVDSWQEVTLAKTVARGVSGVREVTSSMTVEVPDVRPDPEIVAEIEKVFEWDVYLNHALIDVSSSKGEVKLSGLVGSLAEKDRARMNAYIPGVKSVDTEGLQVKAHRNDERYREGKFVDREDSAIADAVSSAMLYDPRVNSTEVSVNVDDGFVTLRGEVDHLKARRSAEMDARNTVGVIGVRNRVKVRPKTDRSAKAIRSDVEAAIVRDPYVELHEITVKVKDDSVHLYGTVDSTFERAHADDVASRTKGVLDVKNFLLVRDELHPLIYEPYLDDYTVHAYDWYLYQPVVARKTDETLERAIRSELWWSPFVDAESIKVTVEDGVASLEGKIGSPSERLSARENALEGGAIKVIDNLTLSDE